MEDLDVLDWRERVAALYLSDLDLGGFRQARDALFGSHPSSPVPADERADFTGLRWYPPDPAAVVEAPLRPATGELSIDTGGPDGVVDYRRVAVAETPWGPLTLWWIDAYGGGLFVPVRDASCGDGSYGGGRYLTDTVKGTFGRGLTVLPGDRVRLDANYLYNPSCAYDDRWACPLAPPENRVDVPLRAGEQAWHD
ncbi:DUF1684 domain-containing protein [Micromonospora robiginosa]|uniref:DUF1684 domain-containing protein n=1 Tax=Micromonospora robiginosa TaxID=2749844 RepID=A0A7L6B0G3_9ACTN|nr:DUF1684 domain-containing protein [Micromonospora ferruginea]QLQ35120.1 DUF1684 domain-containing protein [Micromonospora ferruginea]